jgi:hypothetical protein
MMPFDYLQTLIDAEQEEDPLEVLKFILIGPSLLPAIAAAFFIYSTFLIINWFSLRHFFLKFPEKNHMFFFNFL